LVPDEPVPVEVPFEVEFELEPELLEPEPLAAFAMAAPPPTSAPVTARLARPIRSRFDVRIVSHLLSLELADCGTVKRTSLRRG
jgi:hypothetical protein